MADRPGLRTPGSGGLLEGVLIAAALILDAMRHSLSEWRASIHQDASYVVDVENCAGFQEAVRHLLGLG